MRLALAVALAGCAPSPKPERYVSARVEGKPAAAVTDAGSASAEPGRQAERMRAALAQELEAYRAEKGAYPPSIGAPPDPWGRAFKYETDGRTYTLVSAGEDGRFGTADDIGGRP